MHYTRTSTIAVIGLIFFASCTEGLVGTWKIQKYETTISGQQPVALSNIGTITFKTDHTGIRDIHYSVFGQDRHIKSGFSWTYARNYITIVADDTDIAKSWYIEENKRNMQRWLSTNGRGQIQMMVLKR